MYDECWLAVRVRTGSNYSMSQYFCHTEQQHRTRHSAALQRADTRTQELSFTSDPNTFVTVLNRVLKPQVLDQSLPNFTK